MNDDPTKVPSPAELEEAIEAALTSLKQAWTTTAGPDLAPLLPPQKDPRRTAVLLELIKTDQEHRWQQGNSVRLAFCCAKKQAGRGMTREWRRGMAQRRKDGGASVVQTRGDGGRRPRSVKRHAST